jgi:hypothetical protein
MLRFVSRFILPSAVVMTFAIFPASASTLPDLSSIKPAGEHDVLRSDVILASGYIRKVMRSKRRSRQLRYIYGYTQGHGIAGTPYRSGFSDRAFKSSGFGFTKRDKREGFSERKFRSTGIGFSDNEDRSPGFGSRAFRFDGPRFQKNFFDTRPFRSNGGGFGF